MNRHTKFLDSALVGLLIALTACSGGDPPTNSAPPVLPGAAPTNSPYFTETPGSTLAATVSASPEPTSPAALEPLALDYIFMMTPEVGWTHLFLEPGKPVLRTIDGGQTWRNVTPQLEGYEVRRMVVLDADTAWLVLRSGDSGSAYPLARTTDGGATWTVLAGGLPFLAGDEIIRFTDRLHGWLLSGGVAAGTAYYDLWETGDGGITWARTLLYYPGEVEPNGTLELCNICGDHLYVDGSRLIISRGEVGGYADGTVSLSASWDRGATWRQLEIPFPPGVAADLFSSPQYDMIFFGSTGYLPVAFWDATEPKWLAIYVTRDGGATWQARPDIFPLGARVEFTSAQDVFLVWQGGLYASHDAAATWQVVNPSFGSLLQDEEFRRMDFVSATTGWALSETRYDPSAPEAEKTWWRTTDGGLTWTRLRPVLVP